MTAKWWMTETKQRVLSEAMGFANAAFGYDAATFFDDFEKSGLLTRFENDDGRVTVGCSGGELALMIKDCLGTPLQMSPFREMRLDIVGPIEFWIGYALGYLQGRSGWTFARIFEKFPIERWYDMYILHEVGDETLWDKTLGHYLGSSREYDNISPED